MEGIVIKSKLKYLQSYVILVKGYTSNSPKEYTVYKSDTDILYSDPFITSDKYTDITVTIPKIPQPYKN